MPSKVKHWIVFLALLLFVVALVTVKDYRPMIQPVSFYKAPKSPFPSSRVYLKNFRTVQYRGVVTMPKSGRYELDYEKLYADHEHHAAQNIDWRDGGCVWGENSGKYRVHLQDGDHSQIVKAKAGINVFYECHWSDPLPKPLEYPKQKPELH